jgi:hypothetical protein
MSARHKTLLLGALLCAACGVLLGIATAVWLCRCALRVRVFDSTFHVLSVRVLRNPTDSFYLGNQLEGRVRGFLRNQCHLRVKPLFNVSADPMTGFFGDDGCTFALRYSCEATPSPVPLDAELVDCSGASFGLGGRRSFGTNPYYLLLNLDGERTNAGDYAIKLKRAGVCVVEVEIKDLPPALHKPFRIGPNAF